MRQSLTAVLLSIALVLTGCGKDDPEVAGKDPDEPLTSPVTGLEVDELPANPAFVVKIENTQPGEPQVGLKHADMVVEEYAEGVTRLAAIYHSTLPDKVQHVRSARGTDIGISGALRAPIVASGASSYTIRKIKASGLEYLSMDDGQSAFTRDSNPGVYNVVLDLAALAEGKEAPETFTPYFDFSKDGAKAPGKPVSSVSVRFSGNATTNFAFKNGKWVRVNSHAAPGEDFVSENLVIVVARYEDAGYNDNAGTRVVDAKFNGTGKAVVIQGNKAVDVTWSKAKDSSTLEFTDQAGKTVTMAPGKTWMALVPASDGSYTVK